MITCFMIAAACLVVCSAVSFVADYNWYLAAFYFLNFACYLAQLAACLGPSAVIVEFVFQSVLFVFHSSSSFVPIFVFVRLLHRYNTLPQRYCQPLLWHPKHHQLHSLLRSKHWKGILLVSDIALHYLLRYNEVLILLI